MAQSALTVTPPSPTPPTNISAVGVTPPGDPLQTYIDDGITQGVAGVSPASLNENIPASGTSASPQVFAASTAIGGTAGFVSATHEGKGTETVATATVPNPSPAGQLKTFGCGPSATAATMAAGPNATHASTQSPVTNPALVSISPTTLAAATTGTQVITCTGTNFVPGCRIWHDNVEQTTTFASATSLTATVKKRPNAGVVPVVVKLGGVQMGAAPNFTWT